MSRNRTIFTIIRTVGTLLPSDRIRDEDLSHRNIAFGTTDGSDAEYVYFSASASVLQERIDRRTGVAFSHLDYFGAA